MRRCWVLAAVMVAAGLAGAAWAEGGGGAKVIDEKSRTAKVEGKTAVRGVDGWYFLTGELRAYSRGEFWGQKNAERVAVQRWEERTAATKRAVERGEIKKDDVQDDPRPDAEEIAAQDPLPAIVDFAGQCRKVGVELILVPVPGKVVVYPDKVDVGVQPGEKMDGSQQLFYEALRKEGVTVVDMTEAFRGMREKQEPPYLRQDSHWSPAGAKAAAAKVAGVMQGQAWWKAEPRQPLATEVKTVAVETQGDLAVLVKDGSVGKETVTIEQVKAGAGGEFLEEDTKSPVVVMGDSHVLVYHDNLIGSHGGFADHLAAAVGMKVETLGVRGSGANAGRTALARRGDGLAGKKCIVWLFAARDLTEAFGGWRKVPVVK